MNILITGGNGFIASHLIKELHQKFNITISIRKPIEQNKNIKQIISSNFVEYDWHKDLQDIDIIIHTISLNHSKDKSWSRYYETNYLITQNLLKFLPKSNVKKFFYLSTIKVHGECFKINHVLEKNIETKPYNFYGKSKLITENLSSNLHLKALRCLYETSDFIFTVVKQKEEFARKRIRIGSIDDI